MDIAKRLGGILTANGITVNYTRTTDTFVELDDRAAIANRWKADYFISIHCNASTDRQARGAETYCYDFGGEGEKLAREVQATVVAATGLASRADVKKANFAVLRETTMPAILIEMAFISNHDEEKKLASADFRQKAAGAIAKAICFYLGIQQVITNSASVKGGNDVDTIVTYFGDADVFAAIVVAQKMRAPLMKQSDYEASGIKAAKIVKIGGAPNSDRFDTFKRAAQLL